MQPGIKKPIGPLRTAWAKPRAARGGGETDVRAEPGTGEELAVPSCAYWAIHLPSSCPLTRQCRGWSWSIHLPVGQARPWTGASRGQSQKRSLRGVCLGIWGAPELLGDPGWVPWLCWASLSSDVKWVSITPPSGSKGREGRGKGTEEIQGSLGPFPLVTVQGPGPCNPVLPHSPTKPGNSWPAPATFPPTPRTLEKYHW